MNQNIETTGIRQRKNVKESSPPNNGDDNNHDSTSDGDILTPLPNIPKPNGVKNRSRSILAGDVAQPIGVHKLSHRVDAILAAMGAGGTLMLLQYLNDAYKTPMVGGFLFGSSAAFFFNHSPPTLDRFWKSTIAAIVIGSVLHFSNDVLGEYSMPVVVFFMILYSKLDGSIWGAANALAGYIAVGCGRWGYHGNSLFHDYPIAYIIRPYLSGHIILYVSALGMSALRKRVRIYLLRRDNFSPEKGNIKGNFHELLSDTEKLQRLFNRMDTSGDGRIDETELRVALRAAVGADLSLEDCHYILKSVDTEGNGSIDFHQFCESVDKVFLLR